MKYFYLYILTKSGVVSDKIRFDTLIEAQTEANFYTKFYGNQYRYEIWEE